MIVAQFVQDTALLLNRLVLEFEAVLLPLPPPKPIELGLFVLTTAGDKGHQSKSE